MRYLVIAVAVVVLGVAGYTGGMKMSWFTNNVAQTGEDITPLRLSVPPEEAVAQIVATIEKMERWNVEKVEELVIHATRTTRLMGFVDDITVTVAATPDGDGSVIHARSASRVGVGDFGQNERNIRELWGGVEK